MGKIPIQTSSSRKFQFKIREGFTLIELLLIMGIIAILSSFATINLIKPQTQASVSSIISIIASDLRQQQIKAMVGDMEGAATSQPHGIRFGVDSYTLFRGSFNPTEQSNFTVDLEDNLAISTNLPSSEVVFAKRSGEVGGFTLGSDSVTISNTQGGEQKTITLNRYGTISIN